MTYRCFRSGKLLRRAAAATAAVMMLTAAASCGSNGPLPAESQAASGEICLDGEQMETLRDFLSVFVSRYPLTPEKKWEYDCDKATQGSNIIACIATPASCADWSLYSDIPAEDCFVEKTDDPRGWSRETYAYYVYDGETVDFIAREIFNVSESDIKRLTQAGEAEGLFYNENGRYYTLYEGVFDSFSDIDIVSVTPLEALTDADGAHSRYTVTFNVNGVINKNENDELTLITGKRSAELELKTIHHKKYWSLYRFY